MSKKSRDKGIRGELEAAKVLWSLLVLPEMPERLLDQTRGQENGLDLVVGPFGIQVKRHKSVSRGMADNALREAQLSVNTESGLEYAVAMTRGDRQPWMITMWATDFVKLATGARTDRWDCPTDMIQATVTMEVGHWASFAEEELEVKDVD